MVLSERKTLEQNTLASCFLAENEVVMRLRHF